MQFERTTDYALIRWLLTYSEAIYRRMGDDHLPPREEYVVNEHPDIVYLLARDAGELLGLFVFCPENHICWAAHVCLLPSASRGGRSRQAGREVVEWIWANTPCQRLVASVPAYNRAALRFGTEAMGLEEYGVNERSFLKNGKVIDQILMGRSKEN